MATRAKYNAKYDKSWALIVGINNYTHAPHLQYAVNDATVFAEFLTTRFGFPFENVSILLDEKATRAAIQRSLHSIARDAGDEDRVVVFYAGHGHTVPAYNREAGFLVPFDGSADETSTLLPWDDLVNTSRIIRAKHMLFVMDSCYGGLIGMRAVAPGNARFVKDMLSRYSRQFLTAGKADEVVADAGGPREGHSIFTGHLLNALEGELEARDGLLSANMLMAHVYDRVSKDPHSLQAPHYGFLAGDGDLFLTMPIVAHESTDAKPSVDVLMEVPPDLTAPEDVLVAPPLIEQVKEFLSDSKHRIQLNDIVMRELRAAQQRLGEAQFSVQGRGIGPEEFSARLLSYEEAVQDLIRVSVLLGHWAEFEQQGVIRQIVNAIAGGMDQTSGGLVIWLALRYYPMLLLMYSGGIASLASDNFSSLKTILTTPVRNERRGSTESVLYATANAMLDVNQANAFKLLPGLGNRYTPQSDYLFQRIHPFVEDLLFLGNRYEDLFDRFELFYALVYADLADSGWGPVGRFAWKHQRIALDSPFNRLVEEAKREGEAWAPLRAGLFRGSSSRFLEVASSFRRGLLEKLNWH